MSDKVKTSTMGSPPYYDATPPVMSRSGGKSMGGNSWTIPSGAKYGLGEGTGPTTMSRSGGKSMGGNSWEVPAAGPARSSTKDTGGNTSMGRKYGVGGVSVGGNGNYGGS